MSKKNAFSASFTDSGTPHIITLDQLAAARVAFEANECRDLFYRAATELVELALRRATSLTLAEALAVLLQTWNKSMYQYRKFDSAHFESIEQLLRNHEGALAVYRNRSIDTVELAEQESISTLFQNFERTLGPVGAAKVLHLLAPAFFPLWDRAIAKSYRLGLQASGRNGERYWRFLQIAKHQCDRVAPPAHRPKNLLKGIDEYNYCKFTKGWLT